MKLKDQDELKILYAGDLNEEMEDALFAILKPFGYNSMISGYNTIEKLRDIAFLKKQDPKIRKRPGLSETSEIEDATGESE